MYDSGLLNQEELYFSTMQKPPFHCLHSEYWSVCSPVRLSTAGPDHCSQDAESPSATGLLVGLDDCNTAVGPLLQEQTAKKLQFPRECSTSEYRIRSRLNMSA